MKLHPLKSAITAGIFAAAMVAPAANAQWATFDISNFIQNMQQVMNTMDQLNEMQRQLEAAKATVKNGENTVKSLTGSRGMGRLVTDSNRSYLDDSNSILAGNSAKLSSLAKSISEKAGYLSDQDLSGVNEAYRTALRKSGNQAATGLASQQRVFDQSEERFGRLANLMTNIDGATDAKAIADLQARIQVEQVYLQNDMIRAQSMQAMLVQQQAVEREAQKQRVMSEKFEF